MCAVYCLEGAFEDNGEDVEELLPEGARSWPAFVREAVVCGLGWQRASELEWEVSGRFWAPSETVGMAFGDLPNPFEPWLRLWATGYLLDAQFNAEEQAWNFYAPALGANVQRL